MSSFCKGAALVCLSLLFTALLLEAGLYLFPVNEGLHTQAVSADRPFLRFEANRTATWSKFADFSLRNTVHANNFGFLNEQDYAPDAASPLVAVIGDSYVEAAMVPPGETIHARLGASLTGRARVYSFGASGAPLSQYLAYAEFAGTTFSPQAMVMVVVGNDFDESLLRPDSMPGFHYFQWTGEEEAKLVRLDFQPSAWTRLARRSRLAMYLFTNVQVQHLPARLNALFFHGNQEQYAGQTRTSASPERIAQSTRAIKAFLEQLPERSGLRPDDILFVVDGIRPQLYAPDQLAGTEGSYIAIMRSTFMEEARRRGYHVEDMQPVFQADYRSNGKPFEFTNDGHWNGYGHGVAASRALRSPVLQRFR